MGLFTGLLTLPLAPVRGVAWVTEKVAEQAELELYDEQRIMRELAELEAARDDGTIDEETFEPTYHLRLGLPGKSAGLAIATRLGMPEDIMRRARLSMSDRERDVTRFLSELHRRIAGSRAGGQLESHRRLAVRLRHDHGGLLVVELPTGGDWHLKTELRMIERAVDRESSGAVMLYFV